MHTGQYIMAENNLVNLERYSEISGLWLRFATHDLSQAPSHQIQGHECPILPIGVLRAAP